MVKKIRVDKAPISVITCAYMAYIRSTKGKGDLLHVNVRITQDQYNELKALAEHHLTSISAIARDAMRRGLLIINDKELGR